MKKVQNLGNNATVTMDTTGLNNLMAGVDENFFVKVGILGSKAHSKHRKETSEELKKSGGHKIGSKESELTNADIGLRHEKGVVSERLPRRSWLVTPLEDHLPEYFEKIGQDAIDLIISQKIYKNYQNLGIICEQIIQKGFETGGYGKWKSLSALTIANKGSSAILIDTGQLRKAVTSEVVSA
jgi:hypothetical protein